MPAPQYLIRQPNGRMLTVLAHSVDGAKREYLATEGRKLAKGAVFSIKLRGGSADWDHFKVL